MRKTVKIALLTGLIASVSQSVHAFSLKSFFGFGDKEEQQEQQETGSIEHMAKQLLSGQSTTQNNLTSVLTNPLIQSVTGSLEVSDTQAASGTAALLAMASSQLGASGSTELTELVPQLASITNLIPSNLSNQLDSLTSVQSLFSGLGMDSSMVSQFVPVILNALTGLGASNNLLGQLSSLWSAS